MKNHKYDQKLKVTPTCFFIIPEKKLTLGLKKLYNDYKMRIEQKQDDK